jgi:cell division protein FtsB
MEQPNWLVTLVIGAFISAVLTLVVSIVVAYIGLSLEYHSGRFRRNIPEVPQPTPTPPTLIKSIIRARYALFGSWDRRLLTLSLFIGLLTICLAALRLRELDPVFQSVVVRDFLMYGLWACIVIAVLYRNLLGERVHTTQERKISQLEQIRVSLEQKISQLEQQQDALKQAAHQAQADTAGRLNAVYQIVREAYQALQHHKRLAFLRSLPMTSQEHAFDLNDTELTIFRSLCIYVTDGVRASLQQYFKSQGTDIGEDIAVTVKLVLRTDQLLSSREFYEPIHTNSEKEAEVRKKDRWVITLYRDSYTFRLHPEREVSPGDNPTLYDIGRNTAFHVIDEGEPDFCSDDLRTLELNHGYRNDNTKWKEQYNSTLVVPISYQSTPQTRPLLFGYLATDSLNAHKKIKPLYDTDEARYIMHHGANILAIFHLMLVLRRQKLDNT